MTDAPVVFKKKSRPAGLSNKRKFDGIEDTTNEPAVERQEGEREKEASKDEEEETSEVDWQTLDELKEFQKLKRKVNRGVNVNDLLEVKTSEDKVAKVKKPAVGLTDAATIASDLDLGNTFSAETNRRDEDAEMAKFIEEELAKRKGLKSTEDDSQVNKPKVTGSVDELVFNVLPSDLLQPSSSKQKSEEMLSAQMLLGIPEVNLGIDEKVRNLEETEKATKKLLASQLSLSKNKSTPELAPSNMAVNFTQKTRTKVHEGKSKSDQMSKAAVTIVQEPVVVIGDEPRQASFKNYNPGEKQLKHPGQQKASDDYYFEKYRKQFKKK